MVDAVAVSVRARCMHTQLGAPAALGLAPTTVASVFYSKQSRCLAFSSAYAFNKMQKLNFSLVVSGVELRIATGDLCVNEVMWGLLSSLVFY